MDNLFFLDLGPCILIYLITNAKMPLSQLSVLKSKTSGSENAVECSP